MNMEQALHTYVGESRSLLAEMEDALLVLERDPSDQARIGAVFRAVHTIKGSAGLFGLDEIVGFAHEVEHLLDRWRDGRLDPSPGLVPLLLACVDQLTALVGCAGAAQPPGPALLAQGAQQLAQLRQFGGAAAPARTPAAHPGAGVATDGKDWCVTVRFGTELFRHGMDPAPFLRYLGELGELGGVAALLEAPAELDRWDPESCYLGWTATVRNGPARSVLEQVFEFVRDECQLEITEIPRQAALAPEPPRQAGSAASAAAVRVNAAKLDHLIDLVGGLVIAGASCAALARQHGNGLVQEASLEVNRFVEQIRESALRLRMVEIGDTFQRFHRMVRDTGRELGKDIVLEVSGADTELDKTLVERIGDPLVHLVRNAIDHGIEAAPQRLAAGKPAQGRVRLTARHEAGSIVLEVADDGAGLDAERILAKARALGLAGPEPLSLNETYALIFTPGFSTAAAVSRLSGRGVGMDVVKSSIEALRGTVEIDSAAGRGTTVRIRLPLTLAIIEGFQVGVGAHSYVVPLDAVLECLELPAATPAGPAHCIDLRGEVLPCLRLGELFGNCGTPGRRENVVVVRYGRHKAGLVVDALGGEVQAVIKPLGQLFRHVHGVAGSTILGNGAVALILDVSALVGLTAATHPGATGFAHASIQGDKQCSSI